MVYELLFSIACINISDLPHCFQRLLAICGRESTFGHDTEATAADYHTDLVGLLFCRENFPQISFRILLPRVYVCQCHIT